MRLLRRDPPDGPQTPEARFRALFDAHSPSILAYGRRRTATASDAADVLAETMTVAWRRIDDVPPGDDALPWLYGVARNVVANHHRSGRRRDRLVERVASHLDPVAEDAAGARADHDWVRAALARLGEVDRDVLTLTIWEGLGPAEVAVALGVPAATVRTRLHRARGRLRIELERTRDERCVPAGHDPHGERPLTGETEEVR